MSLLISCSLSLSSVKLILIKVDIKGLFTSIRLMLVKMGMASLSLKAFLCAVYFCFCLSFTMLKIMISYEGATIHYAVLDNNTFQ